MRTVLTELMVSVLIIYEIHVCSQHFWSSINYDLNASNQNMMYVFETFLSVSLLFPIDVSCSAKDKGVQRTYGSSFCRANGERI